jgi:hypothetical protein
VRYFRTVTSVANFRVIVSEVVFGVNFLAISLETLRCAQQLTNLFMFLYQKGVRSQKYSHQVTLSAVHWQVAPLHQPLSPTTSSVVPGVSSSPRTLFSERHFWGAVRTLTLATVESFIVIITVVTTPSFFLFFGAKQGRYPGNSQPIAASFLGI